MTRVLLVDDEFELLEAFTFALEHAGYEVLCARNGNEAIAEMRRQAPDLVVTDVMMPGMDGLALCRFLRGDAQWARLPVVLHTSAHVNPTVGDPPLWDAFLRKPARMHDFLATVERLIRR